MPHPEISFSGCNLSAAEAEFIRETARDFSKLSLTELSKTMWEFLEWKCPTANSDMKNVGLFSSLCGIKEFSLCLRFGRPEHPGDDASSAPHKATPKPPLPEAPAISIP